jgi:hypothetical protein
MTWVEELLVHSRDAPYRARCIGWVGLVSSPRRDLPHPMSPRPNLRVERSPTRSGRSSDQRQAQRQRQLQRQDQAKPRRPRGTKITPHPEHEKTRTGGRNGDVRLQGHEERVPGTRRPPSGRRRTESPSAVPGSRTREPENPLQAPPGRIASRHRRAASRSGGATSAERDGRPVERRTRCSATFWSVAVAVTGNRVRTP